MSNLRIGVYAVLVVGMTAACAMQMHAQAGKVPKPDLHAGGPSPSSLPNDETTEVTLPGFHLAGAHVETGGACKLESYQVVSDTQIKMKIKGARAVSDEDGTCDLKIRTAGGSTGTYVVIELTEAQEQEHSLRQRADSEAKAKEFLHRAGKKWNLNFAGGGSETLTAVGANDDALPLFKDGSGADVKIAVGNDSVVTILENGCIRSGKLVGTQVKNGTSMGDCKPAGAWSGTVEQ